MLFIYSRTIRFQDTDAAGVVYFANVLAICHEAYEASLAASDINLKTFFTTPDLAIPIIHASVDFYRPMFCGDRVLIHLTPQYVSDNEFEIVYQLFLAENPDKPLAKAITKHVCIDSINRKRQKLSEKLIKWING
ncbi:MAG: acyl-CoA thioesterase [Microcoleaceae cyanobacterium]